MDNPAPTQRASVAEPQVAVVMPAHRAGPTLERSLSSIRACNPQPDEVVVVVDGGDADVVEAARHVASDIVTVDHLGPGGARNIGVEQVESDIVLFIDSDIAVQHDLIERVKELFADPTIDAVFGSYDDAPAESATVSRFRNLLHHWTHQHARRDASTFWAGCGAVRRSAFDAVGGFDAETHRDATIEDIELGRRMIASGHRIVVEPSLQVKHLKHWTLRSMVTTDFAKRGVPWMRLMLAEGEILDDLNTTRAARIRVGLSVLLLVAASATAFGLLTRRKGAMLSAGVAATAIWSDRRFLTFARRIADLEFATASVGLLWIHHLSAGAAAAWAIATWPFRRSR